MVMMKIKVPPNKPLTCRLAAIVVLLLVLPLTCTGDHYYRRQPLRALAATETISTAECNQVRASNYRARLDLYFFYLIEYEDDGTDIDLQSIGMAIATELIKDLKDCDDLERPKFAVTTIPSAHVLSNGHGICEAVSDGNACRVARGTASILLDGDVIEVEAIGYGVVQRVVDDTAFLRDYTGMPLVRTEYVEDIGENLVFLVPNVSSGEAPAAPSTNSKLGDGIWKIALAAALISFVVTIILMYGIYRKRKADAGNSAMKARLAHLQAKRRQFFQELQEDGSHEPGWMTTDPAELPREPSITWSVSDLTSDSQSIRSSLPMDRIAEEGPPDDDYDEEIGTNPSESPDSNRQRGLHSPVVDQHLQFIAHWKDPGMATCDGDGVDAPSDFACGLPSPPNDDTPSQSEDDVTPVHRNSLDEYDATMMSPSERQYLDIGVPAYWNDIKENCPVNNACGHRNSLEAYDATTSPCGCQYLDDSVEEPGITSSEADTNHQGSRTDTSQDGLGRNGDGDNGAADESKDSDALRAIIHLPRDDLYLDAMMAENLVLSDDDLEGGSEQSTPANCEAPEEHYDQLIVGVLEDNYTDDVQPSGISSMTVDSQQEEESEEEVPESGDDDDDGEEECSTVTQVRAANGDACPETVVEMPASAVLKASTEAKNTSTEVRSGDDVSSCSEGYFDGLLATSQESVDDDSDGSAKSNSAGYILLEEGVAIEEDLSDPVVSPEKKQDVREVSLPSKEGEEEEEEDDNKENIGLYGDAEEMQIWVESVLKKLDQSRSVKRLSM